MKTLLAIFFKVGGIKLKTRTITGVFFVSIFLILLYYGSFLLQSAFLLLAVIGLYELFKMNSKKNTLLSFTIACFATFILFFHEHFLSLDIYKLFFIFLFILLVLSVLLHKKLSFHEISFLFVSVFYVSFGFFSFFSIREGLGLSFSVFVMIIIWSTDTFAYLTGKFFGKTKFTTISPNKTIEGSLGGLFFSLMFAFAFSFFFPIFDSISSMILFSLSVSLFVQIGDLVESSIKRQFNVKDSGNILPGHGGILDRFDSLIFVSPFIYFIFLF